METMNSVIIIGSGPAAQTAAIYLSRANLSPLLLEGELSDTSTPGGLLTTTKIVENFPGFPEGVDGFELTERFQQQAVKFGTTVISAHATRVIPHSTHIEVVTKKGSYVAKAVCIATGSTPKRLTAKNYDAFWHKGVSTCAVCDGGLPVFRNVPIAVVGGGDSACEEALHLTHTASKVYLIHRRDTLRASKIMSDRVLQHPNIIPIWNTEVIEIQGSKNVERLILSNVETSEIQELEVRGLFVAIGHTPNSEFVKDILDLDASGYIITTRTMSTSCKGIWAAGDVQDPHYRQAITAAGSGCIAALEIERYLHGTH